MTGLDDISFAGSGASLMQQVYKLGLFLKDIPGADVVAAHFDWDSEAVSGSDEIMVQRHLNHDDPSIWFYSVDEIPGYTFVRAPLIESVSVELLATMKGERAPDVRYWRWVAPRSTETAGQSDPPNLKIGFIVIGYRTEAMITQLTSAPWQMSRDDDKPAH